MSTITFDTLKYAKQLEASGVPAMQAEAFVNAQREILSEALDTSLATRSDMLAIKAEIKSLELKMESKFDLVDAKFDKLSWMMGILIALAVTSVAKQFF